MATYSCSPGYHLIGQQIRRCTDGQWTGPQPVCVLNKVKLNKQMAVKVTAILSEFTFVSYRAHGRWKVFLLKRQQQQQQQ